jgi:hypothetical protein
VALIVEDGTGKPDAESYITVAAASTRHTNLGNAAWAAAASDTVREAALRRATVYMEQAYRDRWCGYRQVTTQALSWPRNSVVVDEFVVVESNVVPPEVANACADLALRALTDDLNADLTRGVVRKKIGPLETEYDRYSPQSKRFRAIDMMLSPFLKGSSATATLVRA